MLYQKLKCLIVVVILSFVAGCEDVNVESSEPVESTDNTETLAVTAEPNYFVWVDEDVTYAQGLSINNATLTPEAVDLKLDVYFPDNAATNRPLFMFIHGGGFTGGSKSKENIVEMADFYASRGWVFVSIDYRTAEELQIAEGMSLDELFASYRGIAPQEWIEFTLQGADTIKTFEQSIGMYMAQRDAKAALRWIVANSDTYNIDTDYISVGGASAGAITTVTLGISEPEDFRYELTIDDDPTLLTTNMEQTYQVKSMVYFWGSNVKLEVFEGVYEQDRYDINDPELFMAHGTDDVNPSTPYEEATELQSIYDELGIYNQLVTLEGAGHGAWDATVDGKGLFEMTFEFLVERQNINVQ